MIYAVWLCLMMGLQNVFGYVDVIHSVESEKKIPDKLLEAIAFVESGQMAHKKRIVHPWTINVQGKGYTFKTKQEAIQAVRQFKAKGIDSIDVGLMQINLRHHPNAFKNLEEAFDPRANIAYAARFLMRLYLKYGSWHQAIRYYHSANPTYNSAYLQRVLKVWAKVRTMNLFQFNKNGHIESASLNWNNPPKALQDFETHIDMGDKKTLPITVSFFPLKLTQGGSKTYPRNTPSTPSKSEKVKQPGAVSHTTGGPVMALSTPSKRRAHQTQRTKQTLHVIPLTASSVKVLPLH